MRSSTSGSFTARKCSVNSSFQKAALPDGPVATRVTIRSTSITMGTALFSTASDGRSWHGCPCYWGSCRRRRRPVVAARGLCRCHRPDSSSSSNSSIGRQNCFKVRSSAVIPCGVVSTNHRAWLKALAVHLGRQHQRDPPRVHGRDDRPADAGKVL